MPYRVFATDYDGTIAHDGVVDAATLDALRRLKAAGVKLVLCTGRELEDFLDFFPDAGLFDSLVMENGAVLHEPVTRQTTLLAPAPPAGLVERLRREGVPISVGHSVVSTFEPHGRAVHDAVRDLRLDWHVVMNKTAVMCLPAGVTKATGLAVALDRLGVPPTDCVAAGDAENDHAMLNVAGLAVAPANATAAVKADADWVAAGERGDGIRELIARWLAGGLGGIPRRHPT